MRLLFLNFLVFFCVLTIQVQFSYAAHDDHLYQGDKQRRATITELDCVKCHDGVVRILKRYGHAHQTLCVECHQGHPPADMEIIPRCSQCHEGKAHFEVQGCISCHADPHKPLDIHFEKDVTKPCISCHTSQIKQLEEFPSIHTQFACSACHWFHGQIQPCQNCHLPHSDAMGQESCLGCHQAHKPLAVTYGDQIVSEDCGSCHTEIYQTLATGWSKHRQVGCSDCHVSKHGMIPRCQMCHEQPHAIEIHEKMPICGDCHGLAHDLIGTEAAKSLFLKNFLFLEKLQ